MSPNNGVRTNKTSLIVRFYMSMPSFLTTCNFRNRFYVFECYWLLLPFSYLSQCWRQKGVFQQSITLAGSKRNLKTIKAKERTKGRWGELWKWKATIRLQSNAMQGSKVSTQVLPYSWRSAAEWESAGCPRRCRRLLFSAASRSAIRLALERTAWRPRPEVANGAGTRSCPLAGGW